MAKPKSPASRKRPPNKSGAAAFSGDESELVLMGRIAAAFGIQGWVKVRAFTDTSDGLGGFSAWWLRTGEGWKSFGVEEFAARPAATVAKLEGVDDRNAAELLRGCDVAVTRLELGEPGAGSIYVVDLVGLDVVDAKGSPLGAVEGFFQTGETSVMVVKGGRERLIPFVAEYVRAVDREARRITVDWEAEFDL